MKTLLQHSGFFTAYFITGFLGFLICLLIHRGLLMKKFPDRLFTRIFFFCLMFLGTFGGVIATPFINRAMKELES
ncbi:MAG: hypothetical protein V4576_01305 [Patescibacteria group bacterium]